MDRYHSSILLAAISLAAVRAYSIETNQIQTQVILNYIFRQILLKGRVPDMGDQNDLLLKRLTVEPC